MSARTAMGRSVALGAVLLVLLIGCGRSSAPDTGPGEPGAGTVVSASAVGDLDPALRDAAAWTRAFTYRSRSGIDDDNTRVTGSVFVPKGDPPAGGFPVVALAPRVIGTATECAASLSPDLLGSAAAATALLRSGNVVFVPDYQGLGTPAGEKTWYHPYLDSTTAGYVMIDGVRAAKKLVPVATSDSWAALGSAEGGQAAWAANELVEDYGSGLNLVAAAGLSPTADFDGLADAAAAGTLTPAQKLTYVAFLAALRDEHPYDLNLDDYRRGAAQQNWDALRSCHGADRIALADQIPPDDLRPATPAALETLRGYLRKTTLPQGLTSAPMYIVYGNRDPVIPTGWTERALIRACQLGDGIQIAQWPDNLAQPADPLAGVDWITARLKGTGAANDCAAYLAARNQPATATNLPTRTPRVPAAPEASAPAGSTAPHRNSVALATGWLPIVLQLVAIAAVVCAVGRRSGSWYRRWIPGALMVGFATAAALRLFVRHAGWTQRAVSWQAVLWNVVVGFAIAVAVLSWRGGWRRRLVSIFAVLLAVLSAGLAVNTATGYFPTVGSLWRQATGSHPDDWIEASTLAQMVRDGTRPAQGVVVWIDSPNDNSGFGHRRELVYLPPAWFGSNPPPALPTAMMLGGEFSQPSDWPVAADAVTLLDRFAAAHRGNAPVVVFPDTTGSVSNDTECVNGPRGNAADHLIKDVVPYVISTFGVSPDPANWGLVGWSSGGTCALMTAVMHPELFGTVVALDGQLGPNVGTKRQTVARLFGGDEQAWNAFDPRTVVEKHGPYPDVAAWLGVSDNIAAEHHPAGNRPPSPAELGEWDNYSEEHAANAHKLCLLLSGHNVECSVVGYGGAHDFASAGEAFGTALPWLAGRLGTPDVPMTPLPGAS